MSREPVVSSSIAAVGYSEPTRTLELEFQNGGVYQYVDVSPQVHAALLAAGSKGAFVNQFIKGHHRFVRVAS